MRHATDPDHVIAVTTIVVARQRRVCASALIGVLWGIGGVHGARAPRPASGWTRALPNTPPAGGGVVHGLAGSAVALLVLATIPDPLWMPGVLEGLFTRHPSWTPQ